MLMFFLDLSKVIFGKNKTLMFCRLEQSFFFDKSKTLMFSRLEQSWWIVPLLQLAAATKILPSCYLSMSQKLFVNVASEQIYLRPPSKNISSSPRQNVSKGTSHSSFMKIPWKEYKLLRNSISLKLSQIDCLSYCVSQKSVKFHLPDSPLTWLDGMDGNPKSISV